MGYLFFQDGLVLEGGDAEDGLYDFEVVLELCLELFHILNEEITFSYFKLVGILQKRGFKS